MSSQAIRQFPIERQQPFLLRDILPGPAWAPYSPQAKAAPVEIRSASQESPADGNPVKGLMVGLALECVLGAGAFGIWHLCHLVR